MANKIQLRRDTAANWTALNPVLASGEMALETDTKKLKIGDGITAWTGLGYRAPDEAGITATVNAALVPSQNVAGFGDSMLGDNGSIGRTTLGMLAQALGVDVFLGGVPGQTSTEVALRQGGLDVRVNVAGNTIPAAATAVAVTIPTPSGTWKTGSFWSFTGSIAGIPGTLTKDTANLWAFTRTTAGAAKTVSPETKFISDQGVANAGRVQVFRAGKNNTTDATLVLRDYLAMTKGLSAAKKRYLALPVYNSTTEPSGSGGYNNVAAINTKLADTFGPDYYDLRGWIIRNGLAVAGITPTSDDTTAMAEDRIPPSLMQDGTHLNKIGRRIEGNRLAEIMVERGWFTSYTPVPGVTATVTNLTSNPRVGVDTTGWTFQVGTGGTGTASRVTTGGPLTNAPTLYRATWTVAPTGQVQVNNGTTTTNLVTPGVPYRMLAYGKTSWAGSKIQALIGWYNGATYLGTAGATVVTTTAGTWNALEATGTAPAGATRGVLSVLVLTTGVMPSAGDTLDVSAMLWHDNTATITPGYNDGDSAGWAWSGAAHASTSSGNVVIS